MTTPGLFLSDDHAEVAVSAPHAEGVELILFDSAEDQRSILLHAADGGMHQGWVDGVSAGQRYGFRVHGPWDPARGLLHDPARLLCDPHAKALTGDYIASPPGLWQSAPVGVIVADPPPPRPGPEVPWDETVIYETHVRGLTMLHPDVDEDLRGTYLGAASQPVVDHLLEIGVTTVELMPVAHHVTEPFLQERGMNNYWGYSTLGWFAPHAGYATGSDGRQVAEFAGMVDRFHAAGLEVVVDVVFNHTAEGPARGPILSMKGLDNPGWYRLDPDDPSRYVDWTGTGNTVNTSSPAVRSAIVAALRWWAEGLGVDGFRFDLATTLGRDADGSFSPDNLAWLSEDPVVRSRKLIAEPWDLGPDGYQLGNFPNGWAEWNGQYRDGLRDVWRGRGTAGNLEAAMGGSIALFGSRPRSWSIDFVTAHDGFTLTDLVSYDHKHNYTNGEENRDGHDDNRSWNSGHEGPTDDPEVNETRRRRAAALAASLSLSAGVPMISGGDELGRTQHGNNNAYALDEEAWYDWSGANPIHLFTRALNLRRLYHPLRRQEVEWLSSDGSSPPDPSHSGVVAALTTGSDGRVLLVFNPTPEEADLALPEGSWSLELDSSEIVADHSVSGSLTVPGWTLLVLTGD